MVAPLAGSVDRNTTWLLSRVRPAVAPLAGSVDRNGYIAITHFEEKESLPSRGAWIEI